MTLLDMRRQLDAAELNFRECSLNGVVSAVDELFGVMQALVAHVAAAEGVSIEEPAPSVETEDIDDEPQELVTDFAADGMLTVPGRGRVLTGPFPFEDGTDPVGKLIRAFGKVHRIRGFERFAILKVIRKDDPVGFLIGAV